MTTHQTQIQEARMLATRQERGSSRSSLIVLLLLVAVIVFFLLQAVGPTVTAYIPVTEEHKTEHSVLVGSGNAATVIFQELQGRWPPDPNEQDPAKKVLCYALRSGEEVLRYLVYAGTGLSATGLEMGNLSWWQYGPAGPEAFGYPKKSLRTMQNVPGDLKGGGYTIDKIDCDKFTPPFQLLTP